MKKAAAILVLMIIIFQMVGVFILFKVRQNHIKQEVKMLIKAGIPSSKLTILTFSTANNNDLRWVDDHEFVFNNQMYDVVKTIEKESEIAYHCLPDTLETQLFKNLNKTVGNEMGKDKTKSDSKVCVFANWFFIDALPYDFDAKNARESLLASYMFVTNNWDSVIEYPPPRS